MKKFSLLLLQFSAVIFLSAQNVIGEKVIGEKVIGEKGQGSQQTPAVSTDTVIQTMAPTVGPYAPKKLMGGDREFDGHGPEIWAWVKLKIVDKKYIDAEIYMHARETVSDWSETEGTWTKRIYTAPAGYEILDIMSGKYSEVHYVSKPGMKPFTPAGLTEAIGGARGVDVPFKDDGLVTRWNIVGDTGGTDISEDDNPKDDTQVTVQLNPLKVRLKKPVKPIIKTGVPALKTQTPPTTQGKG
jgi:hypothetical protein